MASDLTPEELDAIRERVECWEDEDGARLLVEIERLREERDDARSAGMAVYLQSVAGDAVQHERGRAWDALAVHQAVIDRLTAERDAAHAMLRRLEWSACSAHPDRLPVCWCCDGDEPTHAPDCALAALLEGTDDR